MALRESHDIINPPEKGDNIWPTAQDNYPTFRNPFYVVPKIPLNDEAFKKYLESKPEDRPETLHEIMKQHLPTPPPPKQWVKPEGVKRQVWTRKRVVKEKKMSQYQVIPGYPAENDELSDIAASSQDDSEELSDISLSPEMQEYESTEADAQPTLADKIEAKRKHKWIEGTFVPKTRQMRWTNIRVPKTQQRRPRSDFLQRLEKSRARDTYRHIFSMKEEHLKTLEELEQEKEALRKEQEEEKDRELARLAALKVDRRPIKGALKDIWNIGEGNDLPIDIFELDTFCRHPQADIEKLPAMMQQEERANRAFVDYLDQNGISEMLIGTLFMIFSNPGLQENAKELLRLGLGGKPMETANVDDALQNIQDTKDRITILERERQSLQIKLLRTLKDNEIPDEPINPNNIEYPVRRMDYLLKAFLCRSRPGDIPASDVYELPREIPVLRKYNINATGYENDGIGHEGLYKNESTQLDYRPQ